MKFIDFKLERRQIVGFTLSLTPGTHLLLDGQRERAKETCKGASRTVTVHIGYHHYPTSHHTRLSLSGQMKGMEIEQL